MADINNSPAAIQDLLQMVPRSYTPEETDTILQYVTRFNSAGVRPQGAPGLDNWLSEVQALPKHLRDVIEAYTIVAPTHGTGVEEKYKVKLPIPARGAM